MVYDRLTAAALLDLAPDGAERIDVGKNPAGRSVAQQDINALLVERGRGGATVVRLKGGDPFVFARGAEEAAALEAAGVDYEVVPGITSAFAAPASAGIPVTLRYSSTHVTVVTGHEDPAKGRTEVNWEAIAAAGGTIVVLMGVGRWPAISERLLAGGLAPDTPAASVCWGTTPRQSTVRATLATLGDHPLSAPSTIVVGRVAAQRLDWFESRPLFGRRVVITRAASQAPVLSQRLSEAGAEVVVAPTIEIVDPPDRGAALREAIRSVRDFDWVVFTSVNAVQRFCSLVRDGRDLAGVKIAAIGPGTAQALERNALVADLVPPRFVAESLLEAFPQAPIGGARILLPRALVARDVLPEGLADRGWSVEVVAAYETAAVVPSDEARERVRAADAICFTSSSTARNYVEAMGRSAPPVVAAIGPITAATARDLGLSVTVEAQVHSLDGLVAALVDGFADADD